MQKVRATRPHGNAYGDTYQKEGGAEYRVPIAIAHTLAEAGLVELIDDQDKGARPARTRTRAGRTSEGDG